MDHLDTECFTKLLWGPNFVTDNIIHYKFTVLMVCSIENCSDKSYTNIHK